MQKKKSQGEISSTVVQKKRKNECKKQQKLHFIKTYMATVYDRWCFSNLNVIQEGFTSTFLNRV